LQVGALGVLGFHQHAGRGAIGQLRGVAGGDELVFAHHGLELGQRLVGGAAAVAVVFGGGDFAVRDFLRFLVGHGHRGGAGHDLVLVAAGQLRFFGLALALGREAVLRLAADVVALGHDVGGLDHRHVERGLVLDDPRVQAEVAAVAGAAAADLRDAFHAARDHGRRAVDHDAARRHRDGLQARGAEAVHGGAGDADRQARADDALARDVAAGGAFGVAAAEDGVLDQRRVEARALDGRLHGEGPAWRRR
jgi:hypothetical protein